jgi:hypothetical protein
VARASKQRVHVEHAVHLQHPIEIVSAALLEAPAKWFPKAVGVHIAGIPVRKKVAVDFGDAAHISTWAVVPLTWKATFAEQLFPAMTGRVAVSPVSKEETGLTLTGMYDPPLGKLGEQLNETLMHKVADRTVKELAVSIAEKLNRAMG